ncbi:MAG: M20 family peptidase [Miltoncostaeaceae bacterium]
MPGRGSARHGARRRRLRRGSVRAVAACPVGERLASGSARLLPGSLAGEDVKKILLALVAMLAVLVAVLLGRTLTVAAPVAPAAPSEVRTVDGDAVASRLAEAIRFRTISHQDRDAFDPAPFEGFVEWVESTYPRLAGALTREIVNDHSLLFTWEGSDPRLAPILLTGHHDVVPVIPGTEGKWTHPPFDGVVADGYVWGRGALDDKSAVIALLEATTLLVEEGFRPARTVYLAFGHDEEIGGADGAGAIVARLRSGGVQLAWSLDEGSFLLAGILPGLDVPVASINVAEKGYVSIDLVASGEGGHSSMPPRQTAVGVLAAAIVALESEPMPGAVEGLSAEMFDALAPHVPFAARIVLANRWLFGGLLESVLSARPTTNAMVRTTTAATMLSGSIKENVLPIEAVGTVNFRLHPRDTVDDVVAHVTSVIDDERIEVRPGEKGGAASEVSSTTSEGYALIGNAVRSIEPDAIVVPGLTVGGTDSRHYGQIADDAYRFNPMVVTTADAAGFHGTNERISIDNLVRATRIYARLIELGAAP